MIDIQNIILPVLTYTNGKTFLAIKHLKTIYKMPNSDLVDLNNIYKSPKMDINEWDCAFICNGKCLYFPL